ncbi:MFS transporter [Streptomyces sp. NPDC048606]|uniref:MFS transporter n=1 Tax=Streptomyces sp. NPDC048606 TaxID=3154726 RepID=UPI0034430726
MRRPDADPATAPAAPPAAGARPASVRWALAALALSALLSSLGAGIANVALPSLAREFSASFRGVQWVVLAYLLTVTGLIVGAGRLGDLFGRRRLLSAGIALFTAASVLCGLAPTLGLLIAARAAQGVGAAVMMALTMAFVGGTVPREATGRAMGILGTTSAVGTALGPSLGGLLLAGPGWRAIFLVQVPLGVLAFLLVRRRLPADAPAPRADGRPRFDHAGTLVLAATLAAYALALAPGGGVPGPMVWALSAVALCGVVVFVRVEARAAAPLVRPAALRDAELSAGLAMSALVSTVVMATMVVGPFHLSRALGLDAALTGLALSVGPLVAALTGVPAGRLTDRFGARRTTVAGLLVMVTGACLLAAASPGLGVPGHLAPLALLTCGYAVFQTANNAAVMADVPADRRGVVSGLLNLSRNLGLITGASAMGAVFALASGAADVTTAAPGAVAAGTRVTYAVAAALIAVALAVCAGARTRARRRQRPA